MENEFEKRYEKLAEQREREIKDNNVLQTFQALEQVKSQIKERRGKISDVFYITISTIFTLLIIGFAELIDGQYDFSVFLTARFWMEFGTIQIASWLLRLFYKQVNDRKQRRENKMYITLEEHIQDLVDKDNDTPFIEVYSKHDNRNRKEYAYVMQKRYEILKLASKHKVNNIVMHLVSPINKNIDTLRPFIIESDKVIKPKLKSELESQINAIMRTLTKQWLYNNVDTVEKLKYNKVSKTILVSGFIAKTQGIIGNDYKHNNFKTWFMKSLPGIILTVAIIVLVYPILGSGFKNDATSWLRFIVKTFVVISNGILTWLTNEELFKETFMKALRERKDTLNEYYKRFVKNPNEYKTEEDIENNITSSLTSL